MDGHVAGEKRPAKGTPTVKRITVALAVAVAVVCSGIANADPSTAVPGPFVRVIVTLREQADLPAASSAQSRRARLRDIIRRLQETADSAQTDLLAQLRQWRTDGLVRRFSPLWIFDGIVVEAVPSVVEALAARGDVLRVDADETVSAPAATTADAGSPEPNIDLVNAPALWELGFRGGGIVVANMDTGVDVSHPDLESSWRGGTNSWFDPNGEHPTDPIDVNGHGTGTMGVMVGRDAGGTSIGVAPDAQWIAVKIFDDNGVATTQGIHEGFQWLLDPDGDPMTPDAPHVVNNSWTFSDPGCDLTFQPDLQALRAAGILPVFAAGNGGPAADTAFSPSNYPEALAVGATDDGDSIAPFSSLGPSTCGGRQGVFPDVVAPGVAIHTADRFGLYADPSGTSVSAPHVAGGLALLLDAFPNLSADEQEAALEETGADLGPPGPDDTYGNGRLDVQAAYEWLAAPPPPELLLSISASGIRTLGSLTGVRDEDVVRFDGADFAMVFDGSDVGVGSVDVDAVSMGDAGSLLLSFDAPVTIPGVGAVDDSDIVRFDATSLGSPTSGTFQMYFDGSDVGLSGDKEDVDAVELLPDGTILLSTNGKAQITGGLIAHDEDLLALTPTSLGDVTSGSFSIYFDGSDIGLTTAGEDVDGAAVDAAGDVLLSTRGAFSVPDMSGNGADVTLCTPSSLGSVTACDISVFFDSSEWGVTGLGVDAVDLP
jgi:subtilisin family serine protease